MKNKNSVLLGLSIANFIWFIISLFKTTNDLSDTAANNGFILSIMAGIILAIITIVKIFKQYKNYKETQSLKPFLIACFKKEYGKPMFYLIISLILNALPLIIVVGLLCFDSSSKSSSDTDSNSRSNIAELETDESDVDNRDSSNQEINKIAGNTNNNIKQIPEESHNEIQKIYMSNPGISDEDAFAMFSKNHPGTTIETVRAHRPSMDMSCQEINKIAGNTNNNIRSIPEGLHNEIQKIYKNNPGLSDEDAFAMFSKNHPGTNIETVRAHRPLIDMSCREINKIAGNTNNNIKVIPEGLHNEIRKIYKSNPGISDEDAFAMFSKNHPGTNIETVRAHKPR